MLEINSMASFMDNLGDKVARVTRIILVAAIVIVAALIITNPGRQDSMNPFTVGRANAEGIAAAPGYIALTVAKGQNFYIIDTGAQVICVYTINGGQLRLVAARKFDFDTKIWDASVNLQKYGQKLIPFDNGQGIFSRPPPGQPDALSAETYSKAFQHAWEDNVFGPKKRP